MNTPNITPFDRFKSHIEAIAMSIVLSVAPTPSQASQTLQLTAEQVAKTLGEDTLLWVQYGWIGDKVLRWEIALVGLWVWALWFRRHMRNRKQVVPDGSPATQRSREWFLNSDVWENPFLDISSPGMDIVAEESWVPQWSKKDTLKPLKSIADTLISTLRYADHIMSIKKPAMNRQWCDYTAWSEYALDWRKLEQTFTNMQTRIQWGQFVQALSLIESYLWTIPENGSQFDDICLRMKIVDVLLSIKDCVDDSIKYILTPKICKYSKWILKNHSAIPIRNQRDFWVFLTHEPSYFRADNPCLQTIIQDLGLGNLQPIEAEEVEVEVEVEK